MKEEDAVEMEVFRAGDYGERGTWTEEQIERLAADYNAQLHEAPLTLDHAQTGPALGWVRALRRVGDRLVAQVALGPGKVRDFLREGGFKKRSVEIQREHPSTGRPYLRAVSLLGAASPAVEGLEPVAFSAAAAPGTGAEKGLHHADGAVTITSEASYLAKPAEAGDDAERAHLAALLREEMVRLRKLAAERETQHFVRDLRGRGVTLFAKDEAMVARLAHQAWAERPEVTGADGATGADPTLDSLFDWLGGLLAGRALTPPAGEAAPETNSAAGAPLAAVFSERCDPASAALHQRALLIQNANPALSYSEALMEAAAQSCTP